MLTAPWRRLFLAAFWTIPGTWLLLSCVTARCTLYLYVCWCHGLRLSDVNKETTLLYFIQRWLPHFMVQFGPLRSENERREGRPRVAKVKSIASSHHCYTLYILLWIPDWWSYTVMIGGINCQLREFAAALLGPVHFLSPDQHSGIHCLIICAIQLLTPNNLGGTWRRICSPDIRNVSALEVLRNRMRAFHWYQNRWPWMTLNGTVAFCLRIPTSRSRNNKHCAIQKTT